MAFTKKPGSYPKPRFGARASGPRKTFGAHEPTERFQATCNECHAICEVPFKPNGKKPIYCRDCFKGKEGAQRERAPGNYRGESSSMVEQLEMLNVKLDRLIRAV